MVSVPATAIALAGSFTATFSASGLAEGATTLTASTAAGSVDTPVTVVPGGTGGFVINEVDYDQVGTDNAEWCELYNGTGRALDLNGFSLILVNGGTNPPSIYRTLNLSVAGSLGADQYLVVGADSVQASLPPETLFISLGSGSDYIQNGAPDGLALVDTNAGILVDALSYEGSITAVAIPGVGTVSLVEGSPASGADSNTAVSSIARIPDHADTDNAAADWRFVNTPTPGAPNAAGR
ncbi:MAG: lamin tail domain-containing protein [Myxococcales bacterium]|nr:lamin tail domain-containing protein [Myxococcales bacterium]